MDYELITFDESTSEFELKQKIHQLNKQQAVDGILIQMPLPKTLDTHRIINEIAPEKDIDGAHPMNIGLFTSGQEGYVPCTALSAMAFVEASGIDLEGKQVVIVGRSNVVGKPVAQLCLRKNATVTIVHSKTKNIEQITQSGDVVIVAVGQAKLVKKDWIKKGAIVIDVGINVDENNQLCGDVDLDDVIDVVGKISPVPKGVGTVTSAMLLENVMKSYRR